MAYDVARARTILFGGDPLTGDFLADTWEWNGEFWTQVADIGPDPRRNHALCFDATSGHALLFGGASATGLLGDTWSWDGEDWTQLEDSGPAARSGHAVVFDAGRGRAVLFGGESAAGILNDTWEWDGQAWTQQADSGPPPRRGHALGYDLVRGKVVLFGGDPGTGTPLRDTWSWDGANWTQTSNFGAAARMAAAMVSTDVQIAMFGGLSSTNAAPAPAVFRETWVFDGRYWTQRQDIGPGPRWGHAMAYDAGRRTIVLFGGLPVFGPPGDAALPGRLLGDTWEHAETDPAPLPPPPPAPPPGNAGEPTVAALALQPTVARVGADVTASLTMSGVSDAVTQVQLAWVRQSVFDAVTAGGGAFGPNDITLLASVLVPAGSTSAAQNFVAPESGEAVVILAATSQGQLEAYATLTIAGP
jgi:hypothetical protein